MFLSPCLFLIYLSFTLLSPFTNLSLSLPFLFLYPSHFLSPFFPSLFRISSNISFSLPPSSTSFYHFSDVFALITTKFIFPSLPQRPLVIGYSSLKIGSCIKSCIYVTALRKKIIQAETLNMGEYISRFKRQRFPAEVLSSALKEWFLFFPSSTHSRTCVFVPHLIVLSLRNFTYFHCSVSNKLRFYFALKRPTHTPSRGPQTRSVFTQF
jgi:hypothetical protein